MEKTEVRICHPYDEVADQYDEVWSTPEAKKEDRFIMKTINVLAEDVVLDIGCGTGLFLDHYPCHDHYLGLDPSQAMLDQCLKKHPNAITVNQTFEEFLPWLARFDKEYDQIISLFGSPSYIKPESLLQARQYLKPGGQMICMFIAPDYEPETHKYLSNPPPIFEHHFQDYGDYEEFGNYILTRLRN